MNSKVGFQSSTFVERKLTDSENSTILDKSSTTPGVEEIISDYNIKKNNIYMEGKSAQCKDIIQPDRSTKKEIRVVSNTQ